MATSLHVKRMARERVELEKENPDYFVHFKDDNLLDFEAYVVGPDDSLYQHKFVKLRFEIPEKYPFKPPTVTFIQHSGGRIHPNLYVEGKVCLSILGTWPGEPWANSMKCHTVLITIRSLLDSQPYKHEPGCSDSPEFNQYVEHSTWRCLLLDYLEREKAEPARAFLQKHLRERSTQAMEELRRQQEANRAVSQLTSPYGGWRGAGMKPDYPGLIRDLAAAIKAAEPSSCGSKRTLDSPRKIVDLTQMSSGSEQKQPKRTKKERAPIEYIDIDDVLETSVPSVTATKKTTKKTVATTRSATPKRAKKGPSEVIDLT